ncbi:MAG: CRISPR system precrRNA processing endoribonuclease RAMP protein Cas6 [Nitrospirae bacterium]|nr:CRISPR system precrRNA processing endoribonuclease RAMP protein Cas6 [Nitrospirota bacterium]
MMERSPTDSVSSSPGLLPLAFGQFTVTLVPEAPLALPPYPGGMFRGAFGLALQRVVCVTRTLDCPPCWLKDRCMFPYVFDTPPPSNTEIMRKYNAAPHPFVLTPPFPGESVLLAGSSLRVGITLFGKALQYLPYFVFAFERLGQMGLGRHRVRCRLATVEASFQDGAPALLYSSEDRALRAPDPFERAFRLELSAPPPSSEPSKEERLTIEFLTPARVVYQERLARTLDFHVLVRSLMRRIGHLSYFHCGGDVSGVAFREWIERAEQVRVISESLRWYDWERFSGRQQARMTLGGLLGRLTFQGNIAPFLPLLRVGEVTHVGKGTSFGLGQYQIVQGEGASLHSQSGAGT